jgi:hypothetical protein
MPLDTPVQPPVVWNIRVVGTRDAKETQTKTPYGLSQAFSHPQFPPPGNNLWASGDRSSVHERTERSTVKSQACTRSDSHAAIRLNANDPSACTALTSGHSLGSDDDASRWTPFISVWIAWGEIAAVAGVKLV